ncbi:acyltransferase [soil metagenome]
MTENQEALPAGDWRAGGRIPYLDGIRAFSILLVIIAHARASVSHLHIPDQFFHLFGNAWLGVRIFFALSGFLITTLLLQERQKTGANSLSGFYKRRIARIFPAFYLFLFTIAIIAALGGLQIRPQYFFEAGSFTWNYALFWRSSEYPLGDPDVLGHVWTLCLEEQFYLLWPAVVVFLGFRRAWRISVGIVIVVPLVRIYLYHAFPACRADLKSMLPTGIDQIMWGCVAAIALWESEALREFLRRANWMLPAGIGLVILVGLAELQKVLDSTSSLVAPTVNGVGVMLFIGWLLQRPRNAIGHILEWRPLVFLGLLSYSLYLWQQPFFFSTHVNWMTAFPANVLLPFPIAMASYFLVEQPARRWLRKRWRGR